jgi:hypothetical protein
VPVSVQEAEDEAVSGGAVLPVGLPCIAQASIAALLPFEVCLLHVAGQPDEASGALLEVELIKLLHTHSFFLLFPFGPSQVVQHPFCPGVSMGSLVSSTLAGAPVLIRKGNLHVAVLQIMSQTAGRSIASGHLEIVWQRQR